MEEKERGKWYENEFRVIPQKIREEFKKNYNLDIVPASSPAHYTVNGDKNREIYMRRDGQKSTSSFEAIGSWLKDKKKNVYFFNIDEYNKQNGNKPLWYVLTPADREKVERKLKEGSTNLPFKDFSNALSHEEIAKHRLSES